MLILGEASSVSQGTGEPDTGGVTAGGPARRGQGSTGSGKTQLQVGHNRHKLALCTVDLPACQCCTQKAGGEGLDMRLMMHMAVYKNH